MVVCLHLLNKAGPISERARAASLVTGVPTAIGVIALIMHPMYTLICHSSILATIFCALAVVCFLISWCSTYAQYKMGLCI